MKICLVCSHGGHLTETLQLMDAFQGHDVFFATYHSLRDDEVTKICRAHFTDNMGRSVFSMLRGSAWAFRLLTRERPDLIISLGAEIAIPFFYWAKVLGIRTVYIESWCRTSDLSGTGRVVYPVADVFLVQWPELLAKCGKKARYEGAVV